MDSGKNDLYIKQHQLSRLKKLLQSNKVLVIYGPRRTGKTTLIKRFLQDIQEPYLLVNGEDITVQEFLSSQSIAKLKEFVGSKKLLVIDEAQKISKIGINLKLLVDSIPGIKIIATGSSSFELAEQIGEPLVGRKFEVPMYPLAQLELQNIENMHETKSRLGQRLVYGSYPEIILNESQDFRRDYLRDTVNSYLLKDLFELEDIRHRKKIFDLLQLIAFQIGSEVSLSELGTQLSLSQKTVERYLYLLELAFVVIRVRGFSRNLRKEITKTARYYFYDNGIRNSIINNFNSLNTRDDIGKLWENYLFMERFKKREYQGIFSNVYFWRTYTKQEIDLVEDREGKLFGYEFTWSSRKKKKIPSEWHKAYPKASFEVIDPDNYLEFII